MNAKDCQQLRKQRERQKQTPPLPNIVRAHEAWATSLFQMFSPHNYEGTFILGHLILVPWYDSPKKL